MEKLKKIVWNEELSIGNISIDFAHAQLLHIYNDLIDYINTGKNSRKYAAILAAMTDYSLSHFKKEEDYMKKLGYPDLQKHKKIHSLS